VPKYTYLCEACNTTFSKRHSASDLEKKCEYCDVEGRLKKIPSEFRLISGTPGEEASTKPGSLVKQSIEDFKFDLVKEKERLKSDAGTIVSPASSEVSYE
tara:strand:+ start:136 stop:435 length:300 start_codon:yes stop_codon:yes gene_type:complete